MELVLPKNYVEIEEEEMLYLDGGWNWSLSKAKKNAKALLATPALAFVGKALWSVMNKKGVTFAKTVAQTAWATAKAIWALPWWAKVLGFAGAACFVAAIGTWAIFY